MRTCAGVPGWWGYWYYAVAYDTAVIGGPQRAPDSSCTAPGQGSHRMPRSLLPPPPVAQDWPLPPPLWPPPPPPPPLPSWPLPPLLPPSSWPAALVGAVPRRGAKCSRSLLRSLTQQPTKRFLCHVWVRMSCVRVACTVLDGQSLGVKILLGHAASHSHHNRVNATGPRGNGTLTDVGHGAGRSADRSECGRSCCDDRACRH